MKSVFAICSLIFIAMYVIAQTTLVHPKDDGKVHLRWATDPAPARDAQTALFNQMYSGTQVAVDPNATGDSTKVIVQCATGSGPDLIDMQQEGMASMANAGILLDLTPYAKSMGFDPSHTYPAMRDALQVEGKQYRFPCNVWANAMIYNKKIFDDHGVSYPKPNWTYDDFVRIGKELQDKPSKSGKTHVALANWSSVEFCEDLLIGHGGKLFTSDGLHSALDSQEAIATIEQYYHLMYVDKVIPTPADSASLSSQGGWGSSGLAWFSSGKAAMIPIGRWFIIQVPNFPDLQGNLATVPLPRVGHRPSTGAIGARGAAINAKSPHWREALKFLQYLATPDYSKVIVHDGDSLPPSPRIASSGKALTNDIITDPAFHATFITAAENAHPLIYSSFLDTSVTNRWIQEYIEKVENKILTPSQAMHMLAAQMNQQIRVNLERRPDLQKKYEKVTGKTYQSNWQ